MTEYLTYSDLENYARVPFERREEVGKAKEELRVKLENDVKILTNSQVFEDYSCILAGDDCDGAFTIGGEIAMQVLDNELRYRLYDCGFLQEPPSQVKD